MTYIAGAPAISLAQEIVDYVRLMDQNGLSFFHETLYMLRDVRDRMKDEWERPPQDRGAEL